MARHYCNKPISSLSDCTLTVSVITTFSVFDTALVLIRLLSHLLTSIFSYYYQNHTCLIITYPNAG